MSLSQRSKTEEMILSPFFEHDQLSFLAMKSLLPQRPIIWFFSSSCAADHIDYLASLVWICLIQKSMERSIFNCMMYRNLFLKRSETDSVYLSPIKSLVFSCCWVSVG